jgi:hypothetical protein
VFEGVDKREKREIIYEDEKIMTVSTFGRTKS